MRLSSVIGSEVSYKLLFRPFIPQEDVSYFELQKQIHELETMPNAPIRPVRGVISWECTRETP